MSTHPDQVLETLKKKAKRSNKVRNLEVVHAACADAFTAGGADFTYAFIGRMSEQRGGPAPTTLYSQASEDYRTLIDAWSLYAKEHATHPVRPKIATDEDLLQKINDPGVRALFGIAIAERNRFREQLNLLRSQSNITVDLRPLAGVTNVNAKTGEVIQIINPLEGLTEAEIEALAHAVSEAHFSAQGWIEGENGKVLSASGSTVFRAGYTHAVRSIVEAALRSRKPGSKKPTDDLTK